MSQNAATPDKPAPTLHPTFRIRLTMRSDWHAGTGAGRPGNIDRLVIRDDDDLPYIPAKTLRGIWRDACERLARGLDGGQAGEWSRLVDTIFGSQPALGSKDPSRRHAEPARRPIASVLSISAARFPDALAGHLRRDERLRQAVTFVKPGVQIDRWTGQAKSDHLRFEEIARVGAVLEADCAIEPRDGATYPAASALLIVATKLVERIGGKRRRGAGCCKLEILGSGNSPIDTSAAVAWLESNPHVRSAPEHGEAGGKTLPAGELRGTSGQTGPPAGSSGTIDRSPDPMPFSRSQAMGEWLCIPLQLHLESPLAVSYRTVGNVVESLDFLPGTYLLPHVTKVLRSLGLDASEAAARGDLCVLPATPEVDGDRGRPAPMVFHAPKAGRGPNQNSVLINRLLGFGDSEGQTKPVRSGYLGTGNPPAPVRLQALPPILWTHNTIEDEAQRPTPDVGGVYSYEAIPARDEGRPVILLSELRLRRAVGDGLTAQNPSWSSQLQGRLRLGRSKKDDYGSVRLEIGPPISAGHAQAVSPTADGSELVVWLLSDVLLRDEHLRPSTTAEALAGELGRRLSRQPGEITLTPRTDAGAAKPGCLHEAIRVRRLDTWHVGWGLPRPSLVALQAGSCAVFELDKCPDSALVREVLMSGIGERTAEGYGQVSFNDPLLLAGCVQADSSERPRPVFEQPDLLAPGIPAGFARVVEREVWRAEIRRAALCLADDRDARENLLHWSFTEDKPPMSQLGGLRNVLGRLHRTDDRVHVCGWLEHLQSTARRAEKWPGNAIANVTSLLTDDDRVWGALNCPDWPTLTQDGENRLRQELWPFAVRTLLDACIRAHKRALDQSRRSPGMGDAHGT
ncbi:MAG: RAMP superfamily CRISPR-associated protein [Isosphaeraceae bacterium]